MRLFGNLIKKSFDEKGIYSPLDGKLIKLEDVKDPTFSEKLLGDGIAIMPSAETVYSPVCGTVTTVFPTKHAIGIKGKSGMEILIHIGIDTVCLQGKYFYSHIRQGEQVSVGQKLVSFDREAIEKAGYDTTTMVLITNSSEYDLKKMEEYAVKKGSKVMEVYER